MESNVMMIRRNRSNNWCFPVGWSASSLACSCPPSLKPFPCLEQRPSRLEKFFRQSATPSSSLCYPSSISVPLCTFQIHLKPSQRNVSWITLRIQPSTSILIWYSRDSLVCHFNGSICLWLDLSITTRSMYYEEVVVVSKQSSLYVSFIRLSSIE